MADIIVVQTVTFIVITIRAPSQGTVTFVHSMFLSFSCMVRVLRMPVYFSSREICTYF